MPLDVAASWPGWGQTYSRSVGKRHRPSAHPPARLLGFQTACLVSLCHLAYCAHAASHNKRYKAGRASIFGWSAFTMSIRLTGTGVTLVRRAAYRACLVMGQKSPRYLARHSGPPAHRPGAVANRVSLASHQMLVKPSSWIG